MVIPTYRLHYAAATRSPLPFSPTDSDAQKRAAPPHAAARTLILRLTWFGGGSCDSCVRSPLLYTVRGAAYHHCLPPSHPLCHACATARVTAPACATRAFCSAALTFACLYTHTRTHTVPTLVHYNPFTNVTFEQGDSVPPILHYDLPAWCDT